MDLKKLLEMDGEFQAWEVNATNRDLVRLMRMGIVRIAFKTNRNTYWEVVDKEKLKNLIRLKETKIELPKDEPLFSSIIGYEKQKEILLRCIENKQHCLLLGKPSLAKTLFLLELTKIGGYYMTSYVTMASLFDVLTFVKPKILLIDEVDRIKDRDAYALLNNLLQYGLIAKHTYNFEARVKVDTIVIATANTVKNLPDTLISRFLIVKFEEYSDEEYENVVRKLLKDRPKEVVERIIEVTKPYKDVRNALKLARICKSKEDVDYFSDIIKFG